MRGGSGTGSSRGSGSGSRGGGARRAHRRLAAGDPGSTCGREASASTGAGSHTVRVRAWVIHPRVPHGGWRCTRRDALMERPVGVAPQVRVGGALPRRRRRAAPSPRAAPDRLLPAVHALGRRRVVRAHGGDGPHGDVLRVGVELGPGLRARLASAAFRRSAAESGRAVVHREAGSEHVRELRGELPARQGRVDTLHDLGSRALVLRVERVLAPGAHLVQHHTERPDVFFSLYGSLLHSSGER